MAMFSVYVLLKGLLVSPLPGMKMPKCRERSVLLGLCRAVMFVADHRLTRGQLGDYNYSAISFLTSTFESKNKTNQFLKRSI